MQGFNITKVFLAVMTIVYAVALLPAIVFAPFTYMCFDNAKDDTISNLAWWIVTLAIKTIPVVWVCAPLFSWYCYRKAKYKMAVVVCLLPVANVLSTLVGAWLILSQYR